MWNEKVRRTSRCRDCVTVGIPPKVRCRRRASGQESNLFNNTKDGPRSTSRCEYTNAYSNGRPDPIRYAKNTATVTATATTTTLHLYHIGQSLVL